MLKRIFFCLCIDRVAKEINAAQTFYQLFITRGLKHALNTSIDGKSSYSFSCSSENSAYRKMFSLADILQIAVVISLRKQPTFGDPTTVFPAK